MHELSIAQSIIDIAESAMKDKPNGRVSCIHIQVGELSCIEIDALQFSFSIIKENTILKDAALDIETIKGEARCSNCNHVFHLASYGTGCPQCKEHMLHILKGKEMKVLNLVVNE